MPKPKRTDKKKIKCNVCNDTGVIKLSWGNTMPCQGKSHVLASPKKDKKIEVIAWAVVINGELQQWDTGKNVFIEQYEVFPTRIDAKIAQNQWGFPAKIIKVRITQVVSNNKTK
jgi:hypothetical protein